MHIDLVIDADGHCNEPWEDLTPWMPKDYHHRAPVGFSDRHGSSRMYIEGRLSTRTEGLGPGVSGPFAPHIKGGRPGDRDARQRLPDMDRERIDVAIIFGTRVALSVNGLRDKELAGVLCRAVNRWLLEEYLPIDRKRLKGLASSPARTHLRPSRSWSGSSNIAKMALSALCSRSTSTASTSATAASILYTSLPRPQACRSRFTRRPVMTASMGSGGLWGGFRAHGEV